ncbi:Ape3p [Sugiyamaella lignohabitans]|uniref:Peptide hydrolase n=1 Tax=Sugiyamaella lignohabitans TaxID=796027 RepID=A0A167FX70_9ASCO|nr:Ape3p [Sugiyamaella lignohabitans]ANB15816.1 Ape3p [Sugiyamaella lignohabitans]
MKTTLGLGGSLGVLLAMVEVTSALTLPVKGDFNQFVLDAKQVVDTDSLQQYITEKGLSKRAAELYEIAKESEAEYHHPTRVIGSKGHNGTIDYILNSLEEFGRDYYDVSLQAFSAISGSLFSSSLTIDGKNISEASALYMSPPTPDKKPVTAHLAISSNDGCKPSDFGPEVNGSIVLIQRGNCPFGDKSELAGLAGAVAAIIYNNVDGDNIPGTLGTPLGHEVPTMGLSKKLGDHFVEKVKHSSQSLNATIVVDSQIDIVDTFNVIAESKRGDKGNVVMLGAHSDSVAAGPGINDDGSGTISLLEVAQALTNFEVNNAVRFAWWSAEEEGLLGSDHYASNLPESENQKIRLFMDYDMMASPNYAYQIYNANNEDHPSGSGDLKQMYVDFYKSHGLNYTFEPFDGRSDYAGFLVAGIPSGGVATGAEGIKTTEEVALFGGNASIAYDPCYHQLCDDLSNVDYDAWVINTKLIAHSVASYAKSFGSFPVRVKPEYGQVGVASSSVSQSAMQFQYRGPYAIF